MKKRICILLTFALLLTVAGCAEGTEAVTAPSEEVFDVDLTQLSSTMVYSEVYNMMTAPDEYLGKSVKMSGNFGVYQDPNTQKYYFACVIADATACCSQGIEFVLDGDYTYPEDYPELDSSITVSGIFDTYEEGGYRYCQLIHAKMG